MFSVLNIIKNGLYHFVFLLDQIVYSFVNYIYQIFVVVSNGKLLTEDTVKTLSDRLNIIIGIVMLFVVSFSLLKALSNPDNLTKGEQATSKIVSNILLVLIMLALIPTAFRLAYSVQATILESGVIGRVILGQDTGTEGSTAIKNAGFNMAIDTFSAFIFDTDEAATYKLKEVDASDLDSVCIEYQNFYSKTHDGAILSGTPELTVNEIKQMSKTCQKFSYFYELADALAEDDKTIQYYFLVSTIAGGFLVYVMLSFCIDLGVRAAKLAFYQLIAPIPILSKIIPGKKDIYDKWFKATITTFLEVFLKLAIISFAIFLIVAVLPGITLESDESASFAVNTFGKVFLIIGILMFAKQAPKLIGDLFGFDSSKMGLGIRKKLSEGLPAPVKGAAGALGAGSAAMGRNIMKAKKDGKGAWGAIKSGAGGFAGGAKRGYDATKSAKDWKEMKTGMNKGADDAVVARHKRSSYKADHGGTIGAMRGHIEDKFDSAKTFFGGGTSSELLALSEYYKKVSAPVDAMKAEIEKGNVYKNNEEARRIEKESISEHYKNNQIFDYATNHGIDPTDGHGNFIPSEELLSKVLKETESKFDTNKNQIYADEMKRMLGENNQQMAALLNNFNQEFGKNLADISKMVANGAIKDPNTGRPLTTQDFDGFQTALKDGLKDFVKNNTASLSVPNSKILMELSKQMKKQANALETRAYIEQKSKEANK